MLFSNGYCLGTRIKEGRQAKGFRKEGQGARGAESQGLLISTVFHCCC